MLGQIAIPQRRFDEALNSLNAALSLATACGLVYEQALARLALAEMFVKSDQGSAATAHLIQARSMLGELGARPEIARARALTQQLQRTGHRMSFDPLAGSLTAREMEVLRRIAAGESGHEIAASLQISVRTVERHTTNIYAKIGARNRAEATAFAHRSHLIE
jgi:DNA-binding NarL/FixJ family response regulator